MILHPCKLEARRKALGSLDDEEISPKGVYTVSPRSEISLPWKQKDLATFVPSTNK